MKNAGFLLTANLARSRAAYTPAALAAFENRAPAQPFEQAAVHPAEFALTGWAQGRGSQIACQAAGFVRTRYRFGPRLGVRFDDEDRGPFPLLRQYFKTEDGQTGPVVSNLFQTYEDIRVSHAESLKVLIGRHLKSPRIGSRYTGQ